MVIENTMLGGIDAVDDSPITAVNTNDTRNAIIKVFKETFKEKYGDSVISGCIVTQQNTPDQTVAVASGKFLIGGLYYETAGNSSINLSIADSTNPRWDLISVNKQGTFTVTTGTPSATPVVPDLPVDEVPLATIYRDVDDNVIETADIKDSRRLIGTPFYEANNTPVSINYGSFGESGLYKTITVPAFRCQKYIDLEFDMSGYMTTATPSSDDSGNYYAYVYVNGVNQQTFTGRVQYEVGSGSVLSVTSGACKIRFLADDFDFSKPVVIQLYMKGLDNMGGNGSRVYANNISFVVTGE